jgi:hypothetical protein
MWSARLGSLSTGLFVGYLCWYFVSRLTEYTVAGFSTLIGVLAGAGVAGIITRFAEDKSVFGYYPIGLVLGSVGWMAARNILGGPTPSDTSAKASPMPQGGVIPGPSYANPPMDATAAVGILVVIVIVVAVSMAVARARRGPTGEE